MKHFGIGPLLFLRALDEEQAHYEEQTCFKPYSHCWYPIGHAGVSIEDGTHITDVFTTPDPSDICLGTDMTREKCSGHTFPGETNITIKSNLSTKDTLEAVFCPLFGGCPYLGGSIV